MPRATMPMLLLFDRVVPTGRSSPLETVCAMCATSMRVASTTEAIAVSAPAPTLFGLHLTWRW